MGCNCENIDGCNANFQHWAADGEGDFLMGAENLWNIIRNTFIIRLYEWFKQKLWMWW